MFIKVLLSGIILCMYQANKSLHYYVTQALIGWAHTQDDSLLYLNNFMIEYIS